MGLLVLCLWTAGLSAGFGQQRDSLTVHYFLLEDCMITQAYTPTIDQLYRQYQGLGVGFVAHFPNPLSTGASVDAFREEYRLPLPCRLDGSRELARRFGVRITPEVVLYDETRDCVLYQGRIDNLFERVGRRRRVVTRHDLVNALDAALRHQPVPVSKTKAVGCLIPQ